MQPRPSRSRPAQPRAEGATCFDCRAQIPCCQHSPAGTMPVSKIFPFSPFALCFTVHSHHSVMQQHMQCSSPPPPLPYSTPPSPPAFLPVSIRTLRRAHIAQQKHSLSSSEAGNLFNANLPCCERGKLHHARSRINSPSSLPTVPGAMRGVALMEESITHCRVTLLLRMVEKTRR